jgi:YesN/AraC family two-component response regulator
MLRIAKNDIFVRVPNATQLGPYEISPDFRFMEIAIPINLFESLMYGNMRVEPNWWAKQEYLKLHPVFHLTEKSIEFCETYFHLLTLQLQDRQSDYRRQILMLIARGATMELLNYMDKTVSFDEIMRRSSVNSSDYTFRAFTQLLREFPHEREVQWYAKKLNITPKYLSEICKDRSGKSASEWIADVTVSELKHYLRETTLPIREVAKVMEFPNSSFFCQYTKKHTGMTPNHFRKSKEA